MWFQTLLAVVPLVSAASLQQVTNFGNNPTGIDMYVYVPNQVASNPAIIVGLHPCGGSAQEWFSGSQVPSYADSHGWVLVYPSTSHDSNCWDVNNGASLTHGAGGDAAGIASMINYALTTYHGDPSKVFIFGASSGAMMTNVMAGSYPELFSAGAAYSGVADACFLGASGDTPMAPNQTCAQGQINRSAQSWGDLARNSYPGYSGARPRMQIWHGLADTLVRPACGYQALEQWANVLGLTNTRNASGVPSSAWTEVIYGDGSELVGYFGQGVGHFAPVNEQVMLTFFGLLGGSSSTAPPPATTSTTSAGGGPPPSTTAPPSGGAAQSHWGQCGGNGWTGPTACQSPYACQTQNAWYAQCL